MRECCPWSSTRSYVHILLSFKHVRSDGCFGRSSLAFVLLPKQHLLSSPVSYLINYKIRPLEKRFEFRLHGGVVVSAISKFPARLDHADRF
jgi:hypothetical protein